jgi:hypothetical protein
MQREYSSGIDLGVVRHSLRWDTFLIRREIEVATIGATSAVGSKSRPS